MSLDCPLAFESVGSIGAERTDAEVVMLKVRREILLFILLRPKLLFIDLLARLDKPLGIVRMYLPRL